MGKWFQIWAHLGNNAMADSDQCSASTSVYTASDFASYEAPSSFAKYIYLIKSKLNKLKSSRIDTLDTTVLCTVFFGVAPWATPKNTNALQYCRSRCTVPFEGHNKPLREISGSDSDSTAGPWVRPNCCPPATLLSALDAEFYHSLGL